MDLPNNQEENIKKEGMSEESRSHINPMKVLFAMEYVLQGLANPFQGITYQSFFRHLRYDYGLTEAMTQSYFSRIYLAWSFKPIIGFLMDAYGKTKITLIFLLLSGAALYLLTPAFDNSANIFFYIMFCISILFACTDVAVDRATVIEGDEDSKSSGRSKAASVGLNQAICWAAIYGTNILSASTGGWIAENVKIKYLLCLLSLVPLGVLLIVLMLPKDTAQSIPLVESVKNFWHGLNTGPIMWIILFYFLFHFQPALGALWLNHLIEDLHFTQTQIGYADGVSYFGLFIGVLIFAWIGVKWQDKIGLRNLFKIFIILSILVNLTQYLLVDPLFSRVIGTLHSMAPAYSEGSIKIFYLSTYNFFYGVMVSIIRMSTFSLVGAVIPVNAAGSLFAGFMSVANLAYSFSYSTGSWLYTNGLNHGIFQGLQKGLFGIPGKPGDLMSISLLIFIGSMAYILSIIAVQMLPDKRQTQATEDTEEHMTGPEDYLIMGNEFLKTVDIISLVCVTFLFILIYIWQQDIIKSSLLSFFITAFIRKIYLDYCYKKYIKQT